MAEAGSHNPLSQFEIQTLIPLPHLGGFDIGFTNSALMMVMAVLGIALFILLGMRHRALVPGRLQSMVELSYQLVANVVKENAGTEGMRYFSLIFSLFMFVLFGNLLGMIPYFFTFTSHIIVTFALAAFIFIGVTLIGLARHGLHFFSLFMPAGTPWWMAPLMVPIELVSYLARPMSLSIRLAANMLAGHMLLKIMAGFVGIGIVGVLPFSFILIFTGFEIFVAFLQAYIFTLLACIYLNDAIHLH